MNGTKRMVLLRFLSLIPFLYDVECSFALPLVADESFAVEEVLDAGVLVYFYVNKTTGTTSIEEYVPALDIKSEAGTINLFDYLEQEK